MNGLGCLIVFLCLSSGLSFYHETSLQYFHPPSKLRPNAFFGYSATYQTDMKSLVVSAPAADGLGQIYSCEVDANKCDIMNITKEEEGTRFVKMENITRNHDFWLGATVRAGSKFFVACAPRYVRNGVYEEKNNQHGTFGRCYVKSTESNRTDLMQQLTRDDYENYRQGEAFWDSLGWSVDVSSDNKILVGGPGLSQGRALYYMNTGDKPRKFEPKNVIYTFGYSVLFGKFVSTNESYAISSTFGTIGRGKVLIFRSEGDQLVEETRIENESDVGAQFGASMAAVRHKAYSALLVGAPTYIPTVHDYDVGAVYVFVNTDGKLSRLRRIDGQKQGSHFGGAIANLDDLDGDYYQEVAIAAPYEDEGRGAVYLYNGADVLDEKQTNPIRWMQRIQPESVRSFGLSLAPVKDYRRSCNDLAIGAPESDTLILLRCIPSITVTMSTTFPNLQTRSNDTYFVFEVCANVKYPLKLRNIVADISVSVQITHSDAKIVNGDSQNNSIVYEQSLKSKKPAYCYNVTVLTPQNGDYEKKLRFNITAELLNNPNAQKFSPALVKLSKRSKLHLDEYISAANCSGIYESCRPDLHLNISTPQLPYIMGTSDFEKITFTIWNTGEVAYEACLKVQVKGVRIQQASTECVYNKNGDPICSPTNPLRDNYFWKTNVILETNSFTSKDRSITVSTELYNHCSNKTDVKKLKAILTIVANPNDIIVRGTTDYEDNLVKITKNGKRIEQIFTISNNASVIWKNMKCEVHLSKQPYVRYTIPSMYSTKSLVPCNWKNDHIASCDLGDIGKKETVKVIIPVEILPGDNLDKLITNGNRFLNTSLHVLLPVGVKKSGRITTEVLLYEAVVPIWIIIVAVIVGLMLLVLIGAILYQCGFLRRKNKEELKKLIENVAVQRQSMRIRQSMLEEARSKQNKVHGDPIAKKEAEIVEEAIDNKFEKEMKID